MEVKPGNSACILLLNLPSATFCGINLLSFSTSSRFQGIREVPDGWHFLFTGVNDAFALRHGVWVRIGGSRDRDIAPELIVKRWNPAAEELVDETDTSALLQIRANLGSIWKERLTPYRQSVSRTSGNDESHVEETQDWKHMTDCITEGLLSRILGDGAALNHWTINSASSAQRDTDMIPGLTEEQSSSFREKNLNFLPIDLKKTWREGAIGRERTDAAQDRSWALADLVMNSCNGNVDEVIGELQFTFIMVLTLNNNSCMEQWKRLLSLILTCRIDVLKRSSFFARALQILQLQLEHCQDADGGLFDMSDDEGNLLKVLLRSFRHGLDEQTGEGKIEVMDELDGIEDYLNTEHGWHMNETQLRRGTHQFEDGEEVELEMHDLDEDDELGEYAPTVVDLTPEQARQLSLPIDSSLTINTKRSSMKTQVQGHLEESSEEEELDLEQMDARY